MPQRPAPSGDVARPRLRSIITTALMVLLAIMIVRDILARRWGAATPPAGDVTEHSRR